MEFKGSDERYFGLIIAYVIPGFIVVNGLALHWPLLSSWMALDGTLGVGGALYVTLVSIGTGLLVSTVRWMIVDTVLHFSGIQRPDWQATRVGKELQVFELFVLYTYRYYQFYANCLVSLPIFALLIAFNSEVLRLPWIAAVAAIELVLLAGAVDTLRKYYRRTNAILGEKPVIIAPCVR